MSKKERSYLSDKLKSLGDDLDSGLKILVTSVEMEVTIDPYFSNMSVIVEDSRNINSIFVDNESHS